MIRVELRRFPLVALAMLALVVSLWAGLVRLGWELPPLGPASPLAHGPLMVSGFLGTVIGLERAVALRLPWTYAAPLLSGLGAVGLIAGLPGAPLMAVASAVLVAVFVVILGRQAAVSTATMTLGALTWLVGNALWLGGWPVHRVVLWWVGFLVLTIAGERLELSRLAYLSRASRAAFLAAVGLFGAGLALAMANPDAGTRVAGAGALALALWLLGHDIARRTARQAGLPRFIALCVVSGYLWLAIGGLLGLAFGGVAAGPSYDAFLHAILLGFVFAMIFGHAPIIFPAVLGTPLLFRPAFYVPLVLLHLTLALRIAGDLASWPVARQWGGLLNALVLLLFLANTAFSVLGSLARPGRGE